MPKNTLTSREKDLLHSAVKGNIKGMEDALIKCWPFTDTNPNVRNNNGRTALVLASFYGKKEAVDFLIRHNNKHHHSPADAVGMDEPDNKGNTALILAAHKGHTDIVAALLKADADATKKEATLGYTALACASVQGHEGVVALLIKHLAPQKGDQEQPLRYSSANHPGINAMDNQGHTPLHLAAYAGHAGVARQLLLAGANPNAMNAIGHTPLAVAAFRGNTVAVKLLIDYNEEQRELSPKVDVIGINRADASGNTPLHLAAQTGQADLVHVLLEAGALPSMQNENGRTALAVAALNGHKNVIEVLKEYNGVQKLLHQSSQADYIGLNVQDRQGNTPLHLAKYGKHAEAAHLLEQAGADLKIRNNAGLTALDAPKKRAQGPSLVLVNGKEPWVDRPDIESRATNGSSAERVKTTSLITCNGCML